MYKKILAATDGSIHGLEAATQAIELAKQCGAELHLLTVTRPFKVSPQLKQFLQAENLMGEPKYVLDEMTERIVGEANELATKAALKKVKTEILEGKPARTIVDYVQDHDIDLVVMGSRGVGELESALLGSVSQKVSLLAGCSVLIVRK